MENSKVLILVENVHKNRTTFFYVENSFILQEST